jgi:hypothetical protein
MRISVEGRWGGGVHKKITTHEAVQYIVVQE